MNLTEIEVNHLNGNMGVTQKIKQAMHDAAQHFVYIGFLLWEVRQYKYYWENGYDSVYEYAETELGFKRSSTKNFIAICENFCQRSGEYKETPTMFLDKRWSDYSYSQLTELLSMSAPKRDHAKPSMTVRQLRELKKQPEELEQITMDELEAQASGQTSGHKTELTIACTVNNRWYDLSEDTVKEACLLTGNKFNSHSNFKIEIKPIPKSVRMDILKRKLCEAAGIKYDPANYNYGFTVERIEK